MDLRGDRRGQSIQIGAIFLFGLLIVAFAGYQAGVVPNQNQGIEFRHSQNVQSQLLNLRNAIVSAPGRASSRSVEIQLGVTYPDRLVALNPGPATGSLRTVGTTNPAVNVSVSNATASGEVGDFWNGTTYNYTTGGLVYTPNYNEYRSAPSTTYQHSVLFNRLSGRTRTLTGQQLVRGNQLTIVTLNGSLGTTRASPVSLDVRRLTGPVRTVPVTNVSAGSPITLTLATRLDESTWRSLLDGEFTTDGGNVQSIRVDDAPAVPFRLLRVELAPGVRYQLRMARVGVGSRTRSPGVAYVTPIDGVNESVAEGGTVSLTIETRDRFNTPVSNVLVNASTSPSLASSVTPRIDATARDGRVELTYTAPSDIDGEPVTDTVNVSLVVDPASTPINASTARNASIPIEIRNADGSGLSGGGGSASSSTGGAYAIDWVNPDVTGANPDADLSNCDAAGCDWDVSASQDATLTLRSTTTPTTQDSVLDFAVGDPTIGTVRPGNAATGSDGNASTELRGRANGTVATYVAQAGSSDTFNVTVTNVTRLGVVYETDVTAQQFAQSGSLNRSTLDFNLTNTYASPITINAVAINSSTVGSQVEDQSTGGNVHEFEFDNGNDGNPESYAETGGSYQIGDRFALDNPEDIEGSDPGDQRDTTHVQINEFQAADGTPVDMVGESIELTIFYEVDNTGARKVESLDIKFAQAAG